MSDLVILKGLRVLAYCGATEDEKNRLQPFEIDLYLGAAQAKAASSDQLDFAVDYEPICEMIENLTKSNKFNLIETFAQTIVDSIFDSNHLCESVEIELKKLRPPVQSELTYASVRIRRMREDTQYI